MFFRNPEIKKSILVHLFLSVLIISCCGFLGRNSLLVSIAVCVVFNALAFFETYRRYQAIANLGSEIDRLLHGEEEIRFEQFEEGEMAILQNEVQKMTVRLREQADSLKKDKYYLMDSLADISHQLRTPMTSIQLILSLLDKKDLDYSRRRELVKELNLLMDKTDWLIESLLKFSKLDAKAVTFKRQTVNIRELVDKAYESIAIMMDLKNQQLNIESDGTEDYEGDFAWSVEAIQNVMKNCMEHMQEGTIHVLCKSTCIYAEIQIEDNGTGIDKDDLPHLFERFYKGKNAGKKSVGIGLALARKIISEQNGTIKAENRLEGGARFIIRFYKGTF